MSYEGDNKRKWHMVKEVSIGDLIGLIAACSAVLVAYGKLDTRVALIEQSQVSQQAEFGRSISRLEGAISEMNRKLDRLIERK